MDKINRKLLILEKDNKFYSLVSIGDIQRAIINNIDLNSPVYKIIRKDIKVAKKSYSFEKIKELMLKYRMEFLPVIDNGEIYKIYYWEELFGTTVNINNEKIDIPVIIMAGGKGTRLKPITNVIPKPLIPIGEKTILEIIFDRFMYYGIKNFYLSVNYKHELIKYYLSNKKIKNINIDYIKENKPMGTAGSLYLIKDKIKERCFITNCDILINQDYIELLNYHVENKNVLTIVGVLKNDEIPYGVIEKDSKGNVKKINEKPNRSYIINSGMYILDKKAIDYIPKNTFYDMTDVIETLINNDEKVSYFPVSEKSWFDIGEWDKYQSTLKEYEKFRNFYL
ncbi:mannose-1-phosphate guanylyltransferase [Geotoga petraea]|uniref:Mannose-1-phosphate guanylyltransferase n=2 Tax=Geotoga petraea TaxID=28234 RepID=A0A4Z0W0Z4_9BACT|nr:mannose-1-phosphate guanylyltransferase [Geotoga petraea]